MTFGFVSTTRVTYLCVKNVTLVVYLILIIYIHTKCRDIHFIPFFHTLLISLAFVKSPHKLYINSVINLSQSRITIAKRFQIVRMTSHSKQK